MPVGDQIAREVAEERIGRKRFRLRENLADGARDLFSFEATDLLRLLDRQNGGFDAVLRDPNLL